MLVFLSWSGTQSKAVAETLSNWIGKVIQTAEPWISLDIDKGARWSPEISQKLEASKVGIICLTKENLDSQWILFEAGALSKTKEAHVCTFLLGLNPSDVQQPLGQFQHTAFEKSDIRRLVSTINNLIKNCGEKPLHEKMLDDVFEVYWPSLNDALAKIAKTETHTEKKDRPERELLEEILELLRTQERRRTIREREEIRRMRQDMENSKFRIENRIDTSPFPEDIADKIQRQFKNFIDNCAVSENERKLVIGRLKDFQKYNKKEP